MALTAVILPDGRQRNPSEIWTHPRLALGQRATSPGGWQSDHSQSLPPPGYIRCRCNNPSPGHPGQNPPVSHSPHEPIWERERERITQWTPTPQSMMRNLWPDRRQQESVRLLLALIISLFWQNTSKNSGESRGWCVLQAENCIPAPEILREKITTKGTKY